LYLSDEESAQVVHLPVEEEEEQMHLKQAEANWQHQL
jgi:hypothetical protein